MHWLCIYHDTVQCFITNSLRHTIPTWIFKVTAQLHLINKGILKHKFYIYSDCITLTNYYIHHVDHFYRLIYFDETYDDSDARVVCILRNDERQWGTLSVYTSGK